MKSFFARTTLFGLSFFAASMATARPFQSRDIINVEFSAKVSKNYLSASAKLNYGKHTLDLSLQPRMPACQEGFMCAQVMPEPVEYSFENVKSTVDRCGVITTTALVDQIPVDGVRMEVALRDNSRSTCGGQKLNAAVMNVKQKWYNRLQGKWMASHDRFTAESVDAVMPFLGVIRAELESVSSERYLGGNLYFDGRKGLVDLTLQPVMPVCPEGMACAQVMPEPISYQLENAQTETDSCGIIRTVAFLDERPVDGIFMKVSFNNNRNNTCPTFAPLAALDVIVEQAYFSRLEGKEVETVDTFKAEDFALIKPTGR